MVSESPNRMIVLSILIMKDLNARIRKLNSKMIFILNRNHVGYDLVKEMRKENRKNRFKD